MVDLLEKSETADFSTAEPDAHTELRQDLALLAFRARGEGSERCAERPNLSAY